MITKLAGFFRKDQCETYYKLTRVLGQGSFATVRLAVCKEDNSLWAIKVIKKTSLGPDDEDALQTEVDILSRLEHPNIVRLKEVFDCPNNFYMVMEMCKGGELFDRIVEKEHYNEDEARKCIVQILQAVAYCHQHHVVHRDLKPENLLYSDTSIDSPLKLADFGLAKLLDETVLMHTACGTPGYVAPEILEGRPYGQEVDLWSVGVISYILLCGFPPFYADDNATLFRTIKSGRYEYPSPFWDEVSDQAKDFIDHLLVLDPQKRLTAEQALQHQWITGQAEGSGKVLSHFHASMRSYNLRRKFRASILTLQALNMMKKMGAELSMSRENSPARSAQNTPLSTNRSDFEEGPQPDSAKSTERRVGQTTISNSDVISSLKTNVSSNNNISSSSNKNISKETADTSEQSKVPRDTQQELHKPKPHIARQQSSQQLDTECGTQKGSVPDGASAGNVQTETTVPTNGSNAP